MEPPSGGFYLSHRFSQQKREYVMYSLKNYFLFAANSRQNIVISPVIFF